MLIIMEEHHPWFYESVLRQSSTCAVIKERIHTANVVMRKGS